jgi:hypothetical protein
MCRIWHAFKVLNLQTLQDNLTVSNPPTYNCRFHNRSLTMRYSILLKSFSLHVKLSTAEVQNLEYCFKIELNFNLVRSSTKK